MTKRNGLSLSVEKSAGKSAEKDQPKAVGTKAKGQSWQMSVQEFRENGCGVNLN